MAVEDLGIDRDGEQRTDRRGSKHARHALDPSARVGSYKETLTPTAVLSPFTAPNELRSGAAMLTMTIWRLLAIPITVVNASMPARASQRAVPRRSV